MKYCQFNGCTNKVSKGAFCQSHKKPRKTKSKTDNKNIYHHKNKPFYKTEEWQSMRWFVIDRERSCCQRCGKFVFGRQAHCHHVISIKQDESLKLEANNIMLLCPKCHVIVENEEKPKKVFPSYFS